jgi:hypothetical protein
METAGFDSVWILVGLLPGFVTAKVRDFFLPPRRTEPFDRRFDVVALAVVNYVVAVSWVIVVRWAADGWTMEPLTSIVRTTLEPGFAGAIALYALSITSVLLGLVIGLVAAGDLHYRLAQRIGLTNRTGREDVWQDVFADVSNGWHLVHLADGRRILGVARYYSDRGDQPSVYVRHAAWVRDDGSNVPIGGDGILIGEAARIQCIEFLEGDSSR